MAESSKQPATQTNDTLPSSTHIQRLEHRRTEPSGIVDVRPFQSRFTRVPEWIVQRSAVLDGILKRYSSQNNTSAEEADLVLVAPSQAVPRDETPTFETATQTTTPSSVPIAHGSRAELTIHRSSTPTKPSVTPSTPQQSPQQGESQRQSPLTVKNSPVAPTLQRTASPSPSSSSSSSSPPPPSGQFRVSRKAIPLPKIQASTPANSTLVSAKKDLGEGKSEDEDEASTITHSSIDASNHPPVAEEMTPIPQQSQNSEQSLVLPKRLSQSSTNNSENSSSSSHLEIENVSSNQNSIQTDISQPTVSQSTINQPPLAREIATKPEISQISTQSLILPKRLQQESSPTADTAHVTLDGDIKRSAERSTIQENLTQQNLAPISRNNTQPQSSIIGKEILKFPPQQSPKSLILPKYLSQIANDSEKSSNSSQLKIGNIFDNQNSIQTDISHPTVSQSTINQPALAREIPTKPEISQISTQSLILLKRLQQSSPTADSAHVTFEGEIERSVQRSTIQENLTQQNLVPISRNNTQPQSSIIGKEILKFPLQQSAKLLILPKRLSQSTNNLEKSSESSQLKIGNIFDNQNSIQTDVSHPTVSQSTINQPPLAREIATKPEVFQASTQSLILPKRLNEINNNFENSGSSSQLGIESVSINQNFIKTDVSQPTINQPTLAREIAQKVDISQIPTQSLILPKRFQQETSPTSGRNHVTLQDGIERSSQQENSTQQNIAKVSTNNAQKQLPIVGEIASTLDELPQPEPSLILPKRLSEASASNAESSGRSRNLPTSTLQQKVARESSLKTSVVAIARSAEPLQAIAQGFAVSAQPNGAQALPIASEIPSTQNSLEQQNIVWRKSVSTASSENLLSHVSDRNHQAGMPLAINSVRGEPYIARQISTTSSPNSIATAEMNNPTHTTTGATPAQTHTQKHEINIAQIAEQVSRILHRNLSIERERRGMNLWY